MAYTTIDDPSAYFQTKLWSGNGSAGTSITNDGNSDLQPDWFWGKVRNHTYNHIVLDSSRGVTNKRIIPNSTDAEDTYAGFMDSFDTDGFTLDNDVNTNESGKTYVAWQWKANGGTTTTNDASATSVGTIDSVYQANTTAGFSIVTHTGSGSAGNIAHGLGAVPEWILTKNRSQAASWANYHVGAGNEYYLELDTSDARETASSVWGDTTPSSTTFRVGGANTKNNSSSDNFVSYCFTPIQGYSKFGSYTGNNNTDGPFVYLGFSPAWIITKRADASDNWRLVDSARNPFNDGSATASQTNNSNNETDSGTRDLDLLSNGFKVRTTDPDSNASSGTYIYMAFASHPFVSSKGVPVTAK